jgi:pimeloyl-ACP methyl ester carboxylesterase
MPFTRTPVLEVQYLDSGPSDGPVVVLVHGFPDDATTWDDVLPLLPAGVRTIRPYLRGCGETRVLRPESDANGAQVAALAMDIIELADRLKLHEFLLVGHDWGARAAHGVAVLEPQRLTGLVTMSTAYGPLNHLSETEKLSEAALAWYRYWLSTEAGASSFHRHPETLIEYAWQEWSPNLRITEAQRKSLLASLRTGQFAELVVHYYRHGAGAAAGYPRYAETQSLLDSWPDVLTPTAFLIGLDDGCELAAASDGNADHYGAVYDRIALPGVGHFIQRERPEIVAEVVTELLTAAAERRAPRHRLSALP